MSYQLEITRPDGSVVTTELHGNIVRIEARPGDIFRILDDSGQPVDSLQALRQGEDLVLEGLPETSKLALCDFFNPGDDKLACVLTRPDAEGIVSPGTEPALLAQGTAATMTDTAVTAPAEAAAGAASGSAAAGGTAAAAATAGTVSTAAMAVGSVAAVGVGVAVTNDDDDDNRPAADGNATDDSTGSGTDGGLQGDGGSTSGGDGSNSGSGNGNGDGSGSGSGSGDSSGSGSATPQTSAPTGTLEGTDMMISGAEAANGTVVSGTAEAGSTVSVSLGSATLSTTADSEGRYAVTFAPGELPGDGEHTLSVTATASGKDPNTADIGTVTLATNGTDLNITSASDLSLSGFDGNDTLVGGHNLALANGNFEVWDLRGFDENYGAVNISTAALPDWMSMQMNYDTDAPDSTDPGLGGWTIVAHATPGASAPLTTGNVGFNGAFEVGSDPAASSTIGWLEFLADGADPTTMTWDTVTSEVSGGGGMSQNLTTVAGQSYSLSLDAVAPTATSSPSDNTADGGTSLEIRWGGETVAFYDATAGATEGAWLTSGDLITPTESGDRITFSGLEAGAESTELAIIAYERYQGSDPADRFNDGVGLRITNIAVDGAQASGAQTLSGGDDADLLYGQGGNDTLYGGREGAPDTQTDTFVYSLTQDNGTDTIMDFGSNDRLYLVDVRNTNGTGAMYMDDVNASSPPAPSIDESTINLNIMDLMSGTEQMVAVSDDGTDTTLTFTGAGEDLGSVKLLGVTGGLTDTYDSVDDLAGAGLLEFTADPFNAFLIAVG